MKTAKLSLTCLAVVFSISAYAGVSHAFPAHHEWLEPANGPSGAKGQQPGGDGIFYTGGVVDSTLRCSSCHIDNQGQQGSISVDIVGTPSWQTKDGNRAYKPGQTYDFIVTLMGEHLGDGGDNNGMTVSIEDPTGKQAGVYEADVGGKSDSALCGMGGLSDPLTTDPTAKQTTVILGDCRAVLSVAHGNGAKARTSWHFKWTAPKAGTGAVLIYIDAVDGDKASASSLNDDVVEGTVTIREGK